VDISNDRGAVLAPAKATAPIAQTTVYDQMARQAGAEADKVIQANLGTIAAAPAKPSVH
jgi:membrane fusion protein (multidrug efflux system)